MSERPYIGDKVEMSMMGDDVSIKIAGIPDDQPFVETDDIYLIHDQYGEEHMIGLDGETWVTQTDDNLSPEGLERWLDRAESIFKA